VIFVPRFRSVACLASLALLPTACGVTPSPRAADRVVVPSGPAVIEFVDPARVPGLGVGTIAQDSPQVHITYPTLADAPALGRGLRAWLRRAVRDRVAAAPRGVGKQGVGHRAVNADWRLVAATGDVLGVRLRLGELTGDGWANGFRTFWYDRPGAALHPSADLLRPGGLAALADAVRRLVAVRRAGVAPSLVTPDPELFDSLTFTRRGDLVVELDDPRIGATERIAVEIPAASAAALLSDLGRRAQAAVRASVPEATTPPAGQRPAPSAAAAPRGGSAVDCAERPCVALAFDDGPGPYTASIVQIMRRYRACGTFFVLGGNAVARPDLVRHVHASCGLVANHTWSHRDLTTLPPSEIADQIRQGRHAIGTVTGTTPALVLPPYGSADARTAAVARELGVTLVRPDVTTGRVGPGAIAERALTGARRNAIVLLHETRATVEALPKVLSGLARRGYIFVTVADLGGWPENPDRYGTADTTGREKLTVR